MKSTWAVFLSGRGSTAQALFDHIDELDIRLVVCSKDNIWGERRARRLGIPTEVLSRPIDWKLLHQKLIRARISRIFLLGFMKIVPESFLQNWEGRIFNLHPSLLPAFPGLHAIERSYEAGKAMGVSVHEVIPEMDAGRLLLQKTTLLSVEDQDLDSCRILISRDEQRLVRTLGRWRSNLWQK